MEDDIDRLLEAGLLDVPPDFTQRVLARLPAAEPARLRRPWLGPLQGLALAVGAASGALQCAAFLTSLWAATAAF